MDRNTIAFAAAALAILVTSAPWAQAQEANSQEQTVEEIRVVAPRAVERERMPSGLSERITMSYGVTYADLDLSKTADVHELENRVDTAANEVCKQLETMYPRGRPSNEACVREAKQNAMSAVEDAVGAAVATD